MSQPSNQELDRTFSVHYAVQSPAAHSGPQKEKGGRSTLILFQGISQKGCRLLLHPFLFPEVSAMATNSCKEIAKYSLDYGRLLPSGSVVING